LLESLGGFQRVEATSDTDEIDKQLHTVWETMVDHGQQQLTEVEVTDFDRPYKDMSDFQKRVGVIWNRTTVSDRIKDPDVRARNPRMEEVYERTIRVQQTLEEMKKTCRRSVRAIFKGRFDDQDSLSRYLETGLTAA